MDYELFINTNLERKSIGDLLYKVASEVIGEEVKFKKMQHSLGFEYVYIGSAFFSIDIDLDDEDDDMEEYQEMNLRYHDVNTNMRISVQMISKTFNVGWMRFLEIIGGILQIIDGDVLLLDDGSFPLMKRKDKILYINSNLDEYRVKYITKENLNLLNYPFIEENFSGK
ncbi:hypothetical protein [Brevibacillus brevis]|uniref:hypothetical protein n=1 Tax=Brevibacillus brevis TaxID=1393 RepID=UPI001EDA923B|nr:hypothetical protein [Brevibacillus brevis]UKK97155.1 hypothetical protein FO446_06880 [Brevibacillus brevis]